MRMLEQGLQKQREAEREKDLHGTGYHTQLGYQKIVINAKHGGFSLSDKALELLAEEYGWEITEYSEDDSGYKNPDAEIIDLNSANDNTLLRMRGNYELVKMSGKDIRDHPDVIEVVEELGGEAYGVHAKLETVEVPRTVDWTIDEYDGAEWVAEKHRKWRANR